MIFNTILPCHCSIFLYFMNEVYHLLYKKIYKKGQHNIQQTPFNSC